jgi:hypothetical protein
VSRERVWTERERIAHVNGCLAGLEPLARAMRDAPLPRFGYDQTVGEMGEILTRLSRVRTAMDLASRAANERDST